VPTPAVMSDGGEGSGGEEEDGECSTLELLPSYKLDLQRLVVLGGAAGATTRNAPTPSHMLASPSKAARASTAKGDLSRTAHFAEIQMVFAAREDGTVAFWDVRSERSRAEVHHLRAHKVLCCSSPWDGASAGCRQGVISTLPVSPVALARVERRQPDPLFGLGWGG
jgi:hypothetical protein